MQMAIKAKASSGVKLPAGRYHGIISQVTDLGIEKTPYGEKERVRIELVGER